MPSSIAEIWLPVNGFEGFYEVSNFGNVRSVANPLRYRPKQKPRIITKSLNTFGYFQVVLSVNGKRHCKRVNRLVAYAFIPNPKKKPCVNHKDGVKTNDCVENLEWVTYSENEQHSYTVLGKNISGIKKTFKNGINPKAKKVLCIEKNIVFNSVAHAAISLGQHRANITAQIRGKIKHSGGFSFEFV